MNAAEKENTIPIILLFPVSALLLKYHPTNRLHPKNRDQNQCKLDGPAWRQMKDKDAFLQKYVFTVEIKDIFLPLAWSEEMGQPINKSGGIAGLNLFFLLRPYSLYLALLCLINFSCPSQHW